MKKNYYAEHQKVLQLFKLEMQKHLKNKIRFFDRHVGLFYTKNGAPIKINQPGMADLYATLNTQYGLIHLEFEIKSGQARQSKDQKKWEKFINDMGGYYFVINCVEKDTQKVLNELHKKQYI